ncbi:MAG: M23 family metallopeptidase [Treponema sp.]|jgi:murein DD-endopeptidase MepM/ murein hydrolase activator NlpD|nr:M23 family metallopeptidase [Treponema sp.]
MGKFGKGYALALFFILLSVRPEGALAEDFPLIGRMDRRDEGFRQFIADVQANRKLVFNRNLRRRDSDGPTWSLTIYRYIALEGDDLLSIAARSNIPYSALASLNRLESRTSLRAGMSVLLPSTPGIFVPGSPDSDLERLLASGRFPAEEGEAFSLLLPGAGGNEIAFHFFPGDEFSPSERVFFLNPGRFRFPLSSFRLTSDYGMRISPISGNPNFHRGIDLAAPSGSEVFAVADGLVTETGYDTVLGNFVRISHPDGWVSLYGHMRGVDTTLGTRVKVGSRIGWVGSTGYSTGPHLHFELWYGSQSRDPGRYLRK